MKTSKKMNRSSAIKLKTTNFVPKNTVTTTKNPLVVGLMEANNVTLTENGALTNKSTLNTVLDLFGLGGALRTRSEQDIINLFTRAFAEDRLSALKVLFYLRDVRSGQGERKTFRTILKYLALNYPDVVRKNLDNVAFFGRFDDLYALCETPLETEMFDLIKAQLKQDISEMKKGKPVSLLAKWLKSINTSSSESRALGYRTQLALGLSSKKYRKTLSSLRAHIDVIERKMCSGEWSEIDYEKVPSKASLNYRKAFGKHDQERYAEYLKSVESGEAKINASAVYPYEIFRTITSWNVSPQEVKMATLQWKNMPNWLEGNEHKGMVIADVSGSMAGNPLLVSVSLAIYFAERNVGPFHNVWMNFSTTPSFQILQGSNLKEYWDNMDKDNWDGSTNLQSAFDLILKTAKANKVAQKDMIEVLYIVSDMEFDYASDKLTNYEEIKRKYKESGYKMPKVVWWNVNARNDQTPIKVGDKGTALVSGCSPSILKSVLSAKSFTPLDVMFETINSERYNRVTV